MALHGGVGAGIVGLVITCMGQMYRCGEPVRLSGGACLFDE